MQHTTRNTGRFLALFACTLVATVTPALAQFGGFRGGGWQESIDTDQLERIAEILELDSEQLLVAKDFLAGYRTEHAELVKEQEQLFEDARDEFRETRDRSIWQKVGDATEAIQKDAEQLEDRFFEDLKLLLNKSQLEAWPRVKRAHRRASTIGRGFLSGESVDLVDVVDDVAPDAENTELEQVLNSYADSLDRALIKRNERYENGLSRARELFQARDFETIQELFKEAREAGLRVRDINERYARQLAPLLPANAREQFRREVNERSFPRIYRRSYAGRVFDTVEEMQGLTDAQREQIESIRAIHRRQASSINTRWEKAVREREENTDIMSMMRQRFRGGDRQSAEREARADRRELDIQTADKVRDILTPEQAEKLPDEPGFDGRRDRGPGRFGGRRGGGST
mgnify:CR=1 FL=1